MLSRNSGIHVEFEMKKRYNDFLEKIFGGPFSIFNRKKLSGDDIVKKWKYFLISVYAHDYAVAKDNGNKKRVVIEKRKMDIAKKSSGQSMT